MEVGGGSIQTIALRGIKDNPPYLHDQRLLALDDTVEFFNLVWAHANGNALRLSGKMAHDDLVCPPPFSACHHPARRLAVCAFHA